MDLEKQLREAREKREQAEKENAAKKTPEQLNTEFVSGFNTMKKGMLKNAFSEAITAFQNAENVTADFCTMEDIKYIRLEDPEYYNGILAAKVNTKRGVFYFYITADQVDRTVTVGGQILGYTSPRMTYTLPEIEPDKIKQNVFDFYQIALSQN